MIQQQQHQEQGKRRRNDDLDDDEVEVEADTHEIDEDFVKHQHPLLREVQASFQKLSVSSSPQEREIVAEAVSLKQQL
jgi:hypothetical protein